MWPTGRALASQCIPGIEGDSHACQNTHRGAVRSRGCRYRRCVQKVHVQRRRLHSGRAQRRSVAFGVRVRHELFLCGHFRRIRRSIRLEIRRCRHVDWYRQRYSGQLAGVVGTRPAHARDDAPSGRVHDAGVLRRALPEQGPAGCGGCHHLRVPDSVHGVCLQRSFAPVRNGVRRALRSVRYRHGRGHLPVRSGRRLHGDGRERFRPGSGHACGHCCGRCGGLGQQWRVHRGSHHAFADSCRRLCDGRPVRLFLRTRPAEPARRHRADEPWYVGSAADGAEVLRYQERSCHQAGCDYFHAFCHGRCRR